MRYVKIPVRAPGSTAEASLELYLLDTPAEKIRIQKRPVIVICPGGGYARTSFREGEPVAMRFLNRGYHACVLRYSVAPARFPAPLLELGIVMKLIHEHGEEWKADTSRIFLQGASAGGHLAGMLGVFWHRKELADVLKTSPQILKPAGMVLCYPVISAGREYIHKESFRNLLGEQYDKYLDKLSLEKQADGRTAPCFLWHTAADRTVPVGNSLVLAEALIKEGVPVELHIFQDGEHGLSLADPLAERADGSGVNEACAVWTELADRWLARL